MKRFIAVVALCVGMAAANANPIPIQIPGVGLDMPKNGTGIAGGNANNDANNLFRLETVLTAWNLANPGSPLPATFLAGAEDLGSNVVPPNGLFGFDYAVLHYGAGDGGTQGSGGGVEVFYLNGATSFTFPANGTGPNGYGGFSSLTLFDAPPAVPDGGMTLVFLTMGLAAVGAARRLVRA